jgi:cytochrome P450
MHTGKSDDEVQGARSQRAPFDLGDLPEGFYDDPYPTYRYLRDTTPLLWLPDGSLFITRYADVLEVYKDTTVFSSDKTVEFKPKFGDSALYEHHTTSLVFNDPPLHTRVRRLLVGALNPKAIDRLQAGLAAHVDSLLDRIAEQGTADLIEDFAAAIPVEIIGNLLDVPRQERGPLRDWSLAILTALEPTITAEQRERGNRCVEEFVQYLRGLVAARRVKPGNPEIDVLTRLIQGEVGGQRLTETELYQNCIFILNAGHETTTNLIGNALVALAQQPDVRALLVSRPELIDSAVEEFLRFESPNQLGNRATTVDCELGGLALPRGTRVNICIGGANRDPEQFPDPDRLDILRTPNRHLAFGWGAHLCAGMNLARLEGRIALSRFLARYPHYALEGAPVRSRRARFRGFTKVPSRLGGATNITPPL